eukprot:m.41317 g.41317  ORF g.41317 m.41317 type:complete len:170 (+) comp8198_c0_seq2:1017-1526(+)
MSDNQPNDNPQPSPEREPEAPSVTMSIEKQPRAAKTAKPKPYLDDHVNQYGQNLISSIATLINQSKDADKPRKKKKAMTPEMLEQCRRNLAKGRETQRKKKQQQQQATTEPNAPPAPKAESNPTPTPKPTPKPAPPTPRATPNPKPVPTVPQPEPESEHLTIRLSNLLF